MCTPGRGAAISFEAVTQLEPGRRQGLHRWMTTCNQKQVHQALVTSCLYLLAGYALKAAFWLRRSTRE